MLILLIYACILQDIGNGFFSAASEQTTARNALLCVGSVRAARVAGLQRRNALYFMQQRA
jgi:hypothetical protein